MWHLQCILPATGQPQCTLEQAYGSVAAVLLYQVHLCKAQQWQGQPAVHCLGLTPACICQRITAMGLTLHGPVHVQSIVQQSQKWYCR